MAKFECTLAGDVDEVLAHLDAGIMASSSTAELEETSDLDLDGVRVRVRVYERYSAIGGNRVSLSVTLVGSDGVTAVSVIASGGSQAVVFKINTWGEQSFLDAAVRSLQRWTPELREG